MSYHIINDLRNIPFGNKVIKDGAELCQAQAQVTFPAEAELNPNLGLTGEDL